jgi:hypothetical protein
MNTEAASERRSVGSPTGRAGKTERPWILRRIEFTFALIVLLILLLATGLLQEFCTRTFTRYPESWGTIQPGMTSKEARTILGEPTADGRHLKSLDRWIFTRNGVSMHLDLWFDDAGEHKTIKLVSRHKRFWGTDTEMSVIQFPPALAP